MDHEDSSAPSERPVSPRGRWALYGFIAVAGFYLVTEHWAHTLGALPFLILLLCPLLHFFHHGGHGGHGTGQQLDSDLDRGKSKGGNP
jgi:Protein of unknown function (DUF2933)